MKFKEAYMKMLEGQKIKRPCFKGYWFINGYDNKLTIHLRTGEEITESYNLLLTINNTFASDWEVVKKGE